MRDYGDFCYLDVEKTGSTYVSLFLEKCCTLPPVFSEPHASLRRKPQPNGAPAYRPGTFYFNSVRNPLATYVSLYNYGCDGRGHLRGTLERAGQGALYRGRVEDFHAWLDFVLDPGNAAQVASGLRRVTHLGLGLVSFRFLRLSLVNPVKRLQALPDAEALGAFYGRANVCAVTLRCETLTEELRALARGRLAPWIDTAAADLFLQRPTVNPSQTRAVAATQILDYPGLDGLLQRESFLIRHFYPDPIAELRASASLSPNRGGRDETDI